MTNPFAPYQTESLFLLVGRNPLPNYVVASLLLKPGGVLYLVHTTGSQGTSLLAQKLATYFASHRPQLIAVGPQDTAGLRAKVEDYMRGAPPGAVGLNYTGGTKVMAVHAYQAVQAFCQTSRRRAVFSYLDADTLEMAIEPAAGRPALRRRVVQSVTPTLQEVFDLHNIQLECTPQLDPILPEMAGALAQMMATPHGAKIWKEGRKILRACSDRHWGAVKTELLQAAVTSALVTALETTLRLQDKEPIQQDAAARHAGLAGWNELWPWLDGFWLEHWALACIEALGYPQRARNLVGLTPSKFEIDVAVLRGYQLFALSCSVTGNSSKAKLKLFEVYTRAKQIGGDEARIGLVCAADDPQGLQQQITREWDSGNHVRVFGCRHLPDLQRYFKNWFETV